MAQPWCTGPVHFSVGVNSTSALYFGTTEGKPYEDENPGWEDLMNDIAGSRIPFDVSQQSQESYFGGTFTRWRYDTFTRITTWPVSGAAGGGPGIPGFGNSGDVGTLMLTEGQAYEIWMVNCYGFNSGLDPKAAMAASPSGPLPGGRHYFFGWLVKSHIERGTSPMRVTCLFRAIPGYNSSGRTRIFYDDDMSGAASPT